MIANSSPPSRATIAPAASASSRAATWRSSASPTGWPSVSLTVLNLSRSTHSSAIRVPARIAPRSAVSSCSRNSTRFGSAGQRIVEGEMGDAVLAIDDLVRHRVEAFGEAADLVVARHGHLGEVARAERACRAIERGDRPGDPARQPYAAEQHEQQAEQAGAEDAELQAAERRHAP